MRSGHFDKAQGRRQVIQTLPQGGLRGQILNTKGLTKNAVVFILVHIVKVSAGVAEDTSHRQQTIPVTDPTAFTFLKVYRQMLAGQLPEPVSSQMITACADKILFSAFYRYLHKKFHLRGEYI